MALLLRVKRRTRADSPNTMTTTVRLDTTRYALADVIALVDHAVYEGGTLILATESGDDYVLEPRRYGAISVLDDGAPPTPPPTFPKFQPPTPYEPPPDTGWHPED